MFVDMFFGELLKINGHWCCGEPMEISGIAPDGVDIYKCSLCEKEE